MDAQLTAQYHRLTNFRSFGWLLWAFLAFGLALSPQGSALASVLYSEPDYNYHSTDYVGLTILQASSTDNSAVYNVNSPPDSTRYVYLPKTSTTTCSALNLIPTDYAGRFGYTSGSDGVQYGDTCGFQFTFASDSFQTGQVWTISRFKLVASATTSVASPVSWVSSYFDGGTGGDQTHFVPTILITDDATTTPPFGTTTPPSSYLPAFTSIHVSTTTSRVYLTGYWTPSDQINFYQDNSIYGASNYQQMAATGTGAFSIYFGYSTPPTPSYVSSTTPEISASINFYADLKDITTDPPVLIDATSTSIYNTPIGSYDLGSTTAILNYPPPDECNILHIGGCIKNVLVWAFFPSQDSLERFGQLGEYIKTKSPFGYFYIVQGQLTTIDASSSPSFAINIPAFVITILSPIDIVLAGLIFVFFLFNFYKRLKHIHI
jgi:hypothetical protein